MNRKDELSDAARRRYRIPTKRWLGMGEKKRAAYRKRTARERQ